MMASGEVIHCEGGSGGGLCYVCDSSGCRDIDADTASASPTMHASLRLERPHRFGLPDRAGVFRL